MRSKFKIGIFFIVINAKIGLLFLTVLYWVLVIDESPNAGGVNVGMCIALTFISLLLFREAKFKWHKLEIRDEHLVIRPFFGLWTKKIKWDQVTGIKRAIEPSKSSDGETIYIYINDVRRVEVSDAYYKNFSVIYRELGKHTRKLGKEEFRFGNNLKNAFGFQIRLDRSK